MQRESITRDEYMSNVWPLVVKSSHGDVVKSPWGNNYLTIPTGQIPRQPFGGLWSTHGVVKVVDEPIVVAQLYPATETGDAWIRETVAQSDKEKP